MHASLCSKQYSGKAFKQPDSDRDNIDWMRQLPARWRELAVKPLRFATSRDYEIAAERTIGLDENEAPCYCAYRVLLTEPRSDDDEEYYTMLVYAESVTSWRLHDGRWLIHRLIAHDEAGRQARGFYSLSESMPR